MKLKFVVGILTAFCLSTAIASEVTVSPQCPPQAIVAVGGGLPAPVDPFWCIPKPDPRSEAIRAFFNAYEGQPNVVFKAMADYGVSASELDTVMNYRINITHYMRANKVADGFAGLKVWDDLLIDKFLIWCGVTTDIDNVNLRVIAQDTLDIAARRKALYASHNIPLPDTVAPWEKL